jgi:hypothetical protein
MGIRDRPTAARSPWQNGYSERLIGSIRRECLDNVVVFGARHLRHLLGSYQKYNNDARMHLSLDKEAPVSRAIGPSAALSLNRSLADCIINTSGFDFRPGQASTRVEMCRAALASMVFTETLSVRAAA